MLLYLVGPSAYEIDAHKNILQHESRTLQINKACTLVYL